MRGGVGTKVAPKRRTASGQVYEEGTMARRRPHRHERQATGIPPAGQTREPRSTINADLPEPVNAGGGIAATGDPRQGAGTLADRDAALPGDVGIGGDDMFGENTAAQGPGDLGKINVHGAGTDQAGFGTTDGAASDPLGGATTGVGSSFGTTPKGADISRGEDVSGEQP